MDNNIVESFEKVIKYLDNEMEETPSRELADHINWLQEKKEAIEKDKS